MAVHVASVHRHQVIYKLKQSCLLRVCSGVSWLSFSVKTANIANTNTMRIMAVFLAMTASPRDRPSQFNCAIEVYNIVIAYAGESSLAMPSIYIGRVEVLAGLGGRTVYYDFIDVSHIRLVVTWFLVLRSPVTGSAVWAFSNVRKDTNFRPAEQGRT